MLIGKAQGSTRISYATQDRISVHGHDLCADLIGKIDFTDMFFLLVTGQRPTATQTFFLDAVLVAIAEHGLVPNVLVSRMTYASDPGSLQGAVAAGILGVGSVVLGTSQIAGELLTTGLQEAEQRGESLAETAARTVRTFKESGRRLPGFGHPLHHPRDPRVTQLFALARERGVAGKAVDYAEALDDAVRAGTRKRLPMNVSMAIPAIMLDVGFPPNVMRGLPLLARTAGLIGHVAEEMSEPIGFYAAHEAERHIDYLGPRLSGDEGTELSDDKPDHGKS